MQNELHVRVLCIQHVGVSPPASPEQRAPAPHGGSRPRLAFARTPSPPAAPEPGGLGSREESGFSELGLTAPADACGLSACRRPGCRGRPQSTASSGQRQGRRPRGGAPRPRGLLQGRVRGWGTALWSLRLNTSPRSLLVNQGTCLCQGESCRVSDGGDKLAGTESLPPACGSRRSSLRSSVKLQPPPPGTWPGRVLACVSLRVPAATRPLQRHRGTPEAERDASKLICSALPCRGPARSRPPHVVAS